MINTLHPSITFTIEKSKHELPFLDILIKKEGTKLITDAYYKKTDTHQYLNFSSCHPSHTERNIPYCMSHRIYTIVADENIRSVRLKELKSYLLKQKNPTKLIDDGIQKAKMFSAEELRRQQTKVKKSRYNANCNNTQSKYNKHFQCDKI